MATSAAVRWARAFVVFNAAQVDGYTPPEAVHVTPEPGGLADWFGRIPADVRWGGRNPCYLPAVDRVLMPAADAFATETARWATLAHELAHWTGHPRSVKLDARPDEQHVRPAVLVVRRSGSVALGRASPRKGQSGTGGVSSNLPG